MTRPDCRIRLVLLMATMMGLIAACSSPQASAPTAQPAPAAPAGAAARPATSASPVAAQAPVLRTLFPDEIVLGQKFNEQPNGQSALAVKVEQATATSSIVFNGTALKTEINPDNVLTAFVPQELVSKEGAFPVYVADGAAESNRLNFTVRPR